MKQYYLSSLVGILFFITNLFQDPSVQKPEGGSVQSAVSQNQTNNFLPPSMIFVSGGTYTMGCTAEQMPDCDSR